jgi:hypothetical protein
MQDFEPGFTDQFWGPNTGTADYELLQYPLPLEPGEGPL